MDSLTLLHSWPFFIIAWFCCLPPPAITSGTWRNPGYCLVWLPNKWSTGTHAATQWGVLPAGQFWDPLVESSRQEWVRHLCTYCPSSWGDVGTNKILGWFGLPLSAWPRHWVGRGEQRWKEKGWGGSFHFSEMAGRPSVNYASSLHPIKHSWPPNSSKNPLGFSTDIHSLGDWQLVL